MKSLFLFTLLLFKLPTLGQNAETLVVDVSKNEVKDGYYIYNVSISNKSDSIVCLLHSIFINPTSKEPQGLALYIKGKTKEEYSLHRSFEDTTYDSWGVPKKGELVMPYQTFNFKIKIYKLVDNIPSYFNIEYFYLTDVCYTDFKKEMKEKASRWYNRFNRLKRSFRI